jgi:hypothetical protein
MAWQTQSIPWENDGTSLASSQAITADGVVGSAVEVGRGDYDIVFTVSGLSITSGQGLSLFAVQANTRGATTTWKEIGNIALGDTTARGANLQSVTNAVVPVKNEGDYQIRVYAYLQGTITTATVTATAYPRRRSAVS